MSDLFVGIDSGTQSTKVVICDGADGRVVARGASPTELVAGLPPGHAEQHPQLWFGAMKAALAEALADIGERRACIRGLGVSGQQHGFVALDHDGHVIRPAKLWCDTSTSQECQYITDALGGLAECLGRAGNRISPGFTAPKVLWLKRHEPANFARLHTVLLPHDYLNFRLAGQRRMEWGDASGTALMDVRSREWSRPVLDAIDAELEGKLPPLRPSWEPCGLLRGDVAHELGLPPGVLVSAGGGDNMMAAIGTGNVRPGVVTASLGTSGTIFACSDRPIVDPDAEIAAFCDSTGQWLPLLCTMNVTVATEAVRRMFGLSLDQFNEAAAGVPPGSDGLLLLPYLEGERTPDVPDGTGVWFGANRATHTPGHFCRAAMEGATLGMNYGLRRMRALGIVPREFRLTGGGARSRVWRQIVADVFNTPVVCTVEPESAALGAAIQARWTWLRQDDPSVTIEQACAGWIHLDESSRCQPDPESAARYAELQPLQDRLSLDLRPSFAHARSLAE